MENKEINLRTKPSIEPKDYPIGVLIMRLQVHELHEAHKALIDMVCNNHKNVILFLGVPVISNTPKNPLNFATRKAMVQKTYPNLVILPLKDQRYDERWSELLDSEISVPFGEHKALLYGGRDSFIPHYTTGKHQVTELTTDTFVSGSEIRKEVSKEILESKDFRAGVIHANFARRAVTFPTVDVVAYNDKGEILMAKKPNEDQWRFIGGFVDRNDASYEAAAKREFAEESGGSEIADLRYVASAQIKDWRYKGEKDGIMTTLFIGKFVFGNATPTDDIEVLKWVNPNELRLTDIMEEHRELFAKLQDYIEQNITEKV